jgi:GntR family transcriptional repressor for pyruvate dehydrogenase complex
LPDGQRDGGVYRPGYEVTAERILQYIAESGLQPGDRLPTEQEFAREEGRAGRTVTPVVCLSGVDDDGRGQRGGHG